MPDIIYGLYDPLRPDLCEYVGVTTRTLEQRLEGYLNGLPKKPRPVEVWAAELRKAGRTPIIRFIANADPATGITEHNVVKIMRGLNPNLKNVGPGIRTALFPAGNLEHKRNVLENYYKIYRENPHPEIYNKIRNLERQLRINPVDDCKHTPELLRSVFLSGPCE